MKKFLVLSLVMTAILLFFSTNSHAIITLGFSPATQTVNSGDPVDVQIVISGLGDGTAPSLGAFDLDVSFDPAILSFNRVAFGPYLGDPDPLLFETNTSHDDSVTGLVNLFELSFLEADSQTCIFCIPPYLDDLQPSSFTLATLTFDTIGIGTSQLGISRNVLGDAWGDPLNADELQSGEVNVVSAVPEPATLLLAVSGLAGLWYFRKRTSCS